MAACVNHVLMALTVSSPHLEEEEEMVALLLPRSYSELSERRDWFALRKRLLLLAKSGRGAPDTDTEPVSSLKTENDLRKTGNLWNLVSS
jgi:hypothetical protein